MKNFVQSVERALTVIAPTGGVVAGAIVIVESIVGVATGTASAGAEVEIRPEGVYDLAKVPADALATGAIAKVDPATGSWVRPERRASAGSSLRLVLETRRRGSASRRGSEAAGSCALNVLSRNCRLSSTRRVPACWRHVVVGVR